MVTSNVLKSPSCYLIFDIQGLYVSTIDNNHFQLIYA